MKKLFILFLCSIFLACTSTPQISMVDKFEGLPSQEGDDGTFSITIGEARNSLAYEEYYNLLYDFAARSINEANKKLAEQQIFINVLAVTSGVLTLSTVILIFVAAK